MYGKQADGQVRGVLCMSVCKTEKEMSMKAETRVSFHPRKSLLLLYCHYHCYLPLLREEVSVHTQR